MSEYWVSKKKYFCKYCDIYITDDAPSRQQHENGLRHKGNTERFIRSIYKAGEKKKKDDEEERREMRRVEQAAQIAFAQDVGAGRAKLASSGPTASTSVAPARKPPPKPSNPYANYSTAKSLGYDDPDAERLAAEAERQRRQGVAGEWQLVTPSAADPSQSSSSSEVETGSKRSAEALDADESRGFKLRKMTMGTGLGQIYDPGAISIKLKKKEEPESIPELPLTTPPLTTQPPSNDAGAKPKWSKLQWKKAGVLADQHDASVDVEGEGIPTKVDEEGGSVKIEGEGNYVKAEAVAEGASTLVKTEEEQMVPLDQGPTALKLELESPAEIPILFKKRKAPTAGTRGRRPGT